MNIGTIGKLAMIPLGAAAFGGAIGSTIGLAADSPKKDGITRKESAGILGSVTAAVGVGGMLGALASLAPLGSKFGMAPAAALGAVTLGAAALAGSSAYQKLN